MFRFAILLSITQIVYSQIYILQPIEIKSQFKKPIQFTIANFGIIPFGKEIKGIAVALKPYDACSKLPQDPVFDTEILLVQRGNCHFVDKVRNAQNAGFKAVIVVDNNALEPHEYILMADDGNGFSIKIPSIFIPKDEGDILMNQAISSNYDKNATKLILQISFPVNILEIATYHIGLQLGNLNSYAFLHDFHRFWEGLGSSAKMDLIYQMYTCQGCINSENRIADVNCLGGGSYCSFSITNDQNNITIPVYFNIGRNLVLESVRQLCIWNDNKQQWWDYMDMFKHRCLLIQSTTICSESIIEEIKEINQANIDKCVSEAFNIKEKFEINNENHLLLGSQLLDRQIYLNLNSGLRLFPGAVVNNITFYGNLLASQVFLDICSSIRQPPQLCISYDQQGEAVFNTGKENKQSIIFIILYVLIILSIFFVLLFFCYRRWAKKKFYENLKPQINGMVSDYMAFTDQQK